MLGTIIAGVFTGRFSDWYTLRLARRNGGLREPEQRLWGLLVYCPFIVIGLLLWGLGAANRLHWAVLLLGTIFSGYCNVAGGAYALAYAVRENMADIVQLAMCADPLLGGLLQRTSWRVHSIRHSMPELDVFRIQLRYHTLDRSTRSGKDIHCCRHLGSGFWVVFLVDDLERQTPSDY